MKFSHILDKYVYSNNRAVSSNLPKYLKKVSKVFDIEALLNEDQTEQKIKNYYKKSALGYKLFHNRSSYIHFAFSDTPHLQKDDYLGSVKIIENWVKKRETHKVLELSAGKGSNSIYLAKKFSDVKFDAIDLSQEPNHIQREIRNFKQTTDDYHKLETITDRDYDLCFVIEGLCHSERKGLVLEQVYKRLRPDGLFIIIDGYREKEYSEMSPEEATSSRLAAKGMALNDIELRANFLKTIEQSNFSLLEEINVTEKIIPNAQKFEFLGRLYFKFPLLGRLIKKIFSEDFTKNSISGLFINSSLELGNGSYYIYVLRKD